MGHVEKLLNPETGTAGLNEIIKMASGGMNITSSRLIKGIAFDPDKYPEIKAIGEQLR
jgi:hypothetical protein